MAGEANSKALFVVFDCLYYDGTRAIPEVFLGKGAGAGLELTLGPTAKP